LENKYKNDPEGLRLIDVNPDTFRPSFLIDEEDDAVFCEEEFLEMRVANTLFR